MRRSWRNSAWTEDFSYPERSCTGKDQGWRKPVKGEGKLFIIDGGISKAYQKQTGIAGYTFIFNSRFMALAEHKPYSPLQEDGSQVFHTPVLRTVKTLEKRMLVRDTDQGEELQQEVEELKELVKAYRNGDLKEQ